MSPAPTEPRFTGMARRLVTENLLTEDEVKVALASALRGKATLVTWLLEQGKVDSTRLAEAVSVEFGLPLVNVQAFATASMPLHLVSEALITKHQALPLFKRGNRLFVAIADPMLTAHLDEIKFHTNCLVEPVLAERQALRHTIEVVLNGMSTPMPDFGGDLELGDDAFSSGDDPAEAPAGVTMSAEEEAPIVKFVNRVLLDAIKRGASDIHFEPFETSYRVRLRLDGMLVQTFTTTPKLASRVASRVKVMAGLDIAERRVPQDGRIKLNLTKTRAVDFRVSTLPTLFGEKIVMRLLDGSAAKMGIDKLGYDPEQKRLYLEAIEKPYGMVLVTGPTGSGKTVSLYTALNILNTPERNIMTVEDPVEIRVEGINQVQQNTKRGMTFSAALRSFLRQDPDVIMVGEIRDLETAEIAIKAAQTGHMVLSTLHTNDAPQTIARLMNMGIAPYNITSSVSLVVAQRLARRLHDCKRPQKLAPEVLLKAGFTEEDIRAGLTLYEAAGCDQCNEGYKGRVGIYQVMPMLESIQQIILRGGNALEIQQVASAAGIADLRTSALAKVKAGMTSLAEIDRVTKE